MYLGASASSPSCRRSCATLWYSEFGVTMTSFHTVSISSSASTSSPGRSASAISNRVLRGSSLTS